MSEPGTVSPLAAPSPGRTGRGLGLILVLLLIGLVLWGILSRRHADQALARWTDQQADPTVTVIRPKASATGDALVLPGTVQALNAAPLYARTGGYVRRWLVDIGAPVKAGQLLALIDAPEVEQQLAAARADLQTARANETLADTTATRWQQLQKQDAVSKQETDERLGDLAAKRAVANAAGANVRRLEALSGFTRIVAPFAGIVTSRTTQIGQLVTAGGGGGAPLFTVADISRMRIYVRVPQAYSAQVRAGQHVTLTLPEYPGRSFDAVLVRTADAVDQQSGTVLVEAQAGNADGALKPGAYAQVRFPLAGAAQSVTIPASAILYRSDGTRVATVDGAGRVHLHNVQIGRDLGDRIEISAGIAATDRVIDSPPDALAEGDHVRLAGAAAHG
ncbi:efflux RND transporter periplasmic adaptor subunit [Sphingomonas morindae]|uniref:Efflux RND transporter periplasmic adaptor subunit n=1 Tax=Sphingomonas morindae TaxID=1541170 RepID=A0ABY4XD25_9SPHN|nr:efflux RND transporter periplasmic adaptor subunit [Sphingomonas morindae]USI74874.1 efflux RND transporter periplasmic adaptor subunit [Sphingomonas morindae]